MSDKKGTRPVVFFSSLITHHSSLYKRGGSSDETITLLLPSSLLHFSGGRAELAAVPRLERLGRGREPEDARQLGRDEVAQRRLEDPDPGALAREPGRLGRPRLRRHGRQLRPRPDLRPQRPRHLAGARRGQTFVAR